jgi:chromosome segregation and condensation protein ScpB
MHDESNPDPPEVVYEEGSTASDDARWQARVVNALLAELPHPLSEAELARELLQDEPSFGERDALERAIEDLRRVGLLHETEELVSLTRAARHYESLPLNE